MAKDKVLAGPPTANECIRVREIDNGYIVSKDYSGPKGYKCTETYVKERPELIAKEGRAPAKAQAPARAKSESNFSAAVKHLEGGHRSSRGSGPKGY